MYCIYFYAEHGIDLLPPGGEGLKGYNSNNNVWHHAETRRGLRF